MTPVATSAVRLSEGILNDGSRVVTGVGLVVRMINTRRRKEEERRKEADKEMKNEGYEQRRRDSGKQ